MSSIISGNVNISIWGQSHSSAVGVTIDGFPSGFEIDLDKLKAFLKRRAPGHSALTSTRYESDEPEFLSGLKNGYTCGAPITAVIRNNDVKSSDYRDIYNTPRPGHADLSAHIKYHGFQDKDGGGHFSGRLTAPLCIAGGICLQYLERFGIKITSSIESIGGVSGSTEKMLEAVEAARAAGDSVGGVVKCEATGVPAGLGDPMFDGMENRLSRVVFGIPAIKGIDFGSGFAGSSMPGSENNDSFYISDGKIYTETNNHGGILGGITTGMPIVFRVAVKPTPSIAKVQKTVDLESMQPVDITVSGRHDPCIALRVGPCVESACAIAILDALLENKKYQDTVDCGLEKI